ncbi:unnamed protein product [Paramecium octaurelia]|uniref:Ubiquitin-like domain-containing protein n=1 Tax=Paramecium octaurelia TaxID=43137 RepID=A0A8S1TV41_PAROT|nr:unnamed protein product [Paramecium octaurelia]
MIQQHKYKVIVKPQDVTLELEMVVSTTIRELYQVLQYQANIQGVIDQWTCLSLQRKKYLNIDEEVGDVKNETFEINTQPQQSQSPQAITTINIKIAIKDGVIERMLDIVLKTSDTLEDVANAVSQYCVVEKNGKTTAVDLFIFGQPFNDKIKRGKSISDLQLKDNLTIEAKIRWIGG